MLECVVDAECDRNQYCSPEGVCIQRCTEGQDDCGHNQYCVNGECQRNCDKDTDCEPDNVCANRVCVASCVFGEVIRGFIDFDPNHIILLA